MRFLKDKMKINKCEKLVCNLYDKKTYVIQIKAVKQALNHELMLDKLNSVIEFSQKAWLKPYIHTNTELKPKTRNDFKKDFFKLLNNSLFGKTIENVRNNIETK